MLKKKEIIKAEIHNFKREFFEKENREAEKEDSEPIKHLYNEYNGLNRQAG